MLRKSNKDELAAIVDDTGRLQAQFTGPFAESDAQDHLKACTTVDHLRGASIVKGKDAQNALVNGRI